MRSMRSSAGSITEDEGLNTGASMRSMRSAGSVMEEEGLGEEWVDLGRVVVF